MGDDWDDDYSSAAPVVTASLPSFVSNCSSCIIILAR